MLNVMGLDVLCNGRLAFLNCTRQTLLSDYFALLPPGNVVIEIQHTVPPDEDVIRACQRLKHAGYSIALDNFEPDDKRVSLVPYASYLKVDIAKIAPGPSALLAAAYGNERCQMLAHKVGTVLASSKEWLHCVSRIFFSTSRKSPSQRNSRKPGYLHAAVERGFKSRHKCCRDRRSHQT
jgi:hypothetical protein